MEKATLETDNFANFSLLEDVLNNNKALSPFLCVKMCGSLDGLQHYFNQKASD